MNTNGIFTQNPQPTNGSQDVGRVKIWTQLRPETMEAGADMTHYVVVHTCREPALFAIPRWEREGKNRSRAGPAAGHVDPLGEAAAVLALDIAKVRVAAAAAAAAVLLGRVPRVPILVLFDPLALVERRLLQVGIARKLAGGRVGGAVLVRGVQVDEVSEVVDVARGEEGSCGERGERGVSPLQEYDTLLASLSLCET